MEPSPSGVSLLRLAPDMHLTIWVFTYKPFTNLTLI